MEALSFLKFWRPTVPIFSPHLHQHDDEDDSFFELELNLPNLNDTETTPKRTETHNSDATPKNRAPLFPSPLNLFSGKKVQPFEAHRRRPHPRIYLFRPSPNFRTFWSRNSSDPETEQVELKTEHRRKTDFSGVSGGVSASKRFGTDVEKRFSKFVRPFSGRGSERSSGEEVKSFRVRTSPLSSPMAAAWKLAGKGRSFSGAAAKGRVLSPAREDGSVSVQQEGIQSAILYCKKSLHADRELTGEK